MPDDVDHAQVLNDQHLARSLAAARQPVPDAVLGTCEACCDEEVMVRPCGGMPRCTPCRSRWEKRR